MTEYLVFDSEEDARQVERAIYNFGVSLAAREGYVIGENGIHGKVTGVSTNDTPVTDKWCKIGQRSVDKKWVVVHPKHHPAAMNVTTLAYMMKILGPVTAETLGEDWWPEDDYKKHQQSLST